ncbi:trypsin-like peptidase domain-containing protein [Pannus brasiliensis CCIBt3594]|uniref:Trypsin-like peptidase domain-containing protein n=1 Tax=Pannus brasiliensis CCIBt3594 TaxID=1427578 RepID=A0AAW9QZ27_9CHRO
MIDRALLRECTVRLRAAGKPGTGFFVAPGLILTCFHVVEGVKESDKIVSVQWTGQDYTAKYLKGFDRSQGDLALLQLVEDLDHERVCLDEDLQPEDKLYTFGYPQYDDKEYKVDGDPRDFDYIDLTGDEYPLITFQRGQVQPGFSGAPLLNLRTGKVCGVVRITRDKRSDLGGRAIPVSTIFACFPELKPKRSAENPFIPLSGGIDKPDKIFGREKEVKEICEQLNSGAHAAIIGESGSGKTTLLWAVYYQAVQYLRQPRKPIYLDLGGIFGDVDFYEKFSSSLNIPVQKNHRERIRRLSQELENRKILLLLDVVDDMRENYFSIKVRRYLRSLANQNDPPLRLVVAANQALDVLFPDSEKNDSPFHGICHPIGFSGWNNEEAKVFIWNRLTDTGITFTEAEIQNIIHQSRQSAEKLGINPRKLMYGCHQLYKEKLNA